ncbi:fasciclin domain-containing protein [Pseudomonas sp. TH43]|uniref:fasciclin domain-containing protein n=1 Tax=Pseudomonas sp. TH43 TaxID=2796407 RepID=UPI0024130C3E|nr:fasciclin domain-containing protein [Pseudomonas sp. TH43]
MICSTVKAHLPFAPTNKAFAKLPAGTVDTLVKPEHRADLTKILTYHVVAGTHTAQAVDG